MGLSIMPFKHNADRRHHIPKMRLRVTNWRQYEAGLRRRGSRCHQSAKTAAVRRRLRSSRVGATLAPGGPLGRAVRKTSIPSDRGRPSDGCSKSGRPVYGLLCSRSVRGGGMAYLDLTPMLQAMRARPDEFEMYGPFLRHIRSQHLLDFDRRGNARVHARCYCAMLQVSLDQSEEMMAAFSTWKIIYWEPHLAQIEAEKRAAKINREFASHFRPPGAWRRFLARFRRNDNPVSLIVADHPDENCATEVQGGGSSEKVSRTEQLELLRS